MANNQAGVSPAVRIDPAMNAVEYFYAESMRRMNEDRLKYGLPVVSTTQCRKIHQVYMDTFRDYTKEGSKFDVMLQRDKQIEDLERRAAKLHQDWYAYMGAVFSNVTKCVNGGQRYYRLAQMDNGSEDSLSLEEGFVSKGMDSSRAMCLDIYKEWAEKTGWDLAYADEYRSKDRELVDSDRQFLPFSPYDPQFSMKRVMLDNGGRVLWGKTHELVSGDNTLLDVENTNLYAMDNDGNMTYRGKLNHQDDLTGLSRLRPYMSDKDYKAVQQTMASAFSNPDTLPTDEMLDKSVAILEWLTTHGYSYTISNDTIPGQLKARIGNTKLDIRILDTQQNGLYIGRCYEEGYSSYYEKPRYNRASASTRFVPDTDDILNMISYTLGNVVERKEYHAGEVSNVMERGRDGRMRPNQQRGIQRVSDNVGRYAGEIADVFQQMDKNARPLNRQLDGLFAMTDDGKGTYPSSQVLMDVRLGDKKNTYTERSFGVVTVRSDHHASHEFFENDEQASAFLKDAIASARDNYSEKLDMERLIEESMIHAGDTEYVPEFSYDPQIAPIQMQYWEVLSGKRDLYKAGMTREDVYQDIVDEEEMSEAETALLDSIFGDAANGQYEGTLADQVRQHMADTLDLEFGQLEPSEEDGLRFNPWNVSMFMTSSYGRFRNNDNVVEAMKQLDIPAEELRGNEFQVSQVKDKLIKFNPENARQMGTEDDSPFMQTLAKTIQETISTSHCTVKPEDILIDDNGIVHYTAQRAILEDRSVRYEPVEGYIGQIFEPDADGVVETKFNGSQNQLFSPGYMAYVLPQEDGESKSLPERIRLKGYQRVLQDNIRTQVRRDLLDPHAVVGTTTNVNNSYRSLYETRYKIHGEMEPGESLKDAYVRECRMTGLPDDAISARFATFRGMVRLPSSFKDDSSLNAAFAHSRDGEASVEDIMNDNAMDAWQLSGGENISVLSADWDGYTDRTATGSAKNQGVVRYLVEGAYVDDSGIMHPALNEDGSINKDARTALMSLDCMKYVDHTPFDRQQMVFSNLSGASAIDSHTGVATMTMGGYTFDDGAIISAAWAEKNGPIGEDGVRRPIGVGDKILDCAGNKSIVGKVIDPNMSAEEFDKLDKVSQKMVEFFYDSPEVSVVMSPYSPMSRFNATSARFAMEDNFEITLPDGSVTYGGYMPMIVTDKTVDEKTKEYGDDEIKAGGGRSASGQFNWILSAVGAYGLMDECYGNNESALANYREYLITMGMDIDEVGRLQVGYHPQGEEQRHYFALPEAQELEGLSRKSAAEMFRGAVDNRGGFLEIPVQITLPSGEKLEPVPADKSVYAAAGIQTYALPIMSSYLRSGQEFQDGTSMTHDYTNHYAQIYAASVEYMNAALSSASYNPNEKDKKGNPVSADAQRSKFERDRGITMNRCAARINKEYKEITSDVENRIFTGKHNYVRDHLMSARLPHSATAVWTAEPLCDIDEVRMPSSMMKTIGKKEGEMVLLWRDPCLHTSSECGMRVTCDDSLTGIAVNPLIAARMDGDFDGDSVGIYGVSSKAGLKDLNDKLAVHNTLLDMTHKNPETGNYELFINTKMDVRSLYARDEEAREKAVAEGHPMEGKSLRERFAELEVRANDIYQSRGEYEGFTFEQKDAANRALCKDISTWTHDLFESYPIGAQTLSMESPEAYLRDLQYMADTKAKGKAANIDSVARYFGMTYDKTEEGAIDYDSVKVCDTTLADRRDMEDTEYAVAVKANGTPLAGQVSLNLAMIARNLCLKDGLDLTYNATQGVLQAKHDSVLAKQQYGMLQNALKSQWRGHKLQSHVVNVYEDALDADGNQVPVLDADGKPKKKTVWTEVKDERGKAVQLSTNEWVQQFMEIHEHKDGMNLAGDVNLEQVERVAKALTNPDTGLVYNIEDNTARQILATPMDRLAYQPSLAATIEAAKNGESIFEGSANEHLAPKVVRENIAQLRAFEEQKLNPQQPQANATGLVLDDEPSVESKGPELKGFGKSDVLEGGNQRPETGYQTSDRFVGANKDGIGNVVVGGYHAPEERPVAKPSLKETLAELLPEEEQPRQMTQEELADAYPSMDASTDEQLLSDAALAYQDRDEYDDDIDDFSGAVEVPSSVSASERSRWEMEMHLIEKAEQERRVREESAVPVSSSLDVPSKDVTELAEKMRKQKELESDGRTSPSGD